MMTVAPKSIKRLIRQLIFIPCLHNRWLTKTVKEQLTQAIAQAETGHLGEIMLVIENHLPIHQAYHQNCYERALDVFGSHRVWDTQNNTGVLIYVNLCEKDLQIVADRGINQKVDTAIWQNLCKTALNDFKQANFESGLCQLIQQVGHILQTYDPKDDTLGNELKNDVVFLR